MAIATSVLVSIAISVALSVGMKLLQSVLNPPRQQQSYGGQLQRHDPGTSVTVREPAAPQKIVFGTRRVAGTIVFAHTTQNNYLLHHGCQGPPRNGPQGPRPRRALFR